MNSKQKGATGDSSKVSKVCAKILQAFEFESSELLSTGASKRFCGIVDLLPDVTVRITLLESVEGILDLNNPFVPARDTAITGTPSLLFLSWTDHLEYQGQSGIERSKKVLASFHGYPVLCVWRGAIGSCARIVGAWRSSSFSDCYRRFCRRYKQTIVIDSKQFQHEGRNGEDGIIVGGKK